MFPGRSSIGASAISLAIRQCAVFAAVVPGALSVGAAGDPPVVRITRPATDEILYGPTRITVEAAPDSGVAQVLFYLEPVPQPICNDREAPFTCEFDAGTEYRGRTIRVRALDGRGRFLAAATVETLAFPEPERVVERIVQVPVVATGEDGTSLDLGENDLECFYGTKPCEVLGFEPIIEKTTMPLSSTPWTTSGPARVTGPCSS